MPNSPIRVLLVDHDSDSATYLAEILTNAGYSVQQARDGSAALAAIGESHPDLVLAACNIPEMDGLELSRRIRQEEWPHYVYTVLMADKSHADRIVMGFEAGADDIVVKPFHSGELLARLHAAQRMLKLERKLRASSKEDPLTGVLNRRTFFELYEREWKRSLRYGLPLSCVLLDIDFFKKINDTYGHPAGDAALRAVAQLLRRQCRATEYVCRFGGEEFCVLLPETNERGASTWAERVRSALAELTIEIPGEVLKVTGSFGVAERLDDMQGPEDAVEAADQALLVAKQSGRDRVVAAKSLHDGMPNLADGQQRNALAGLLARDVMAVLVHSLHQDDSLQRAAELFLQLRLGSVPVVDDDGKLVGMVSEKDLMTLEVAGQSWDCQVRDIMKRNVICYDETALAETVFQFLCRVSIRRVVVVRDGRPIGIVSRSSLIRWFRNWMLANRAEQPSHEDERKNLFAGVMATARALAECGEKLPSELLLNERYFVPCAVSEATQLQELINDLLGHCQTAGVAY